MTHFVATSIDHINMYVTDLAESVAFYHDLFGFEVKENQPQQISQIVGNDSIKLCLYEDPDQVGGSGIKHFGFCVEDFDAVVEQCKALNLEMPYGVLEWEHSRSVYIVDPSGYEIELSEIEGGGL